MKNDIKVALVQIFASIAIALTVLFAIALLTHPAHADASVSCASMEQCIDLIQPLNPHDPGLAVNEKLTLRGMPMAAFLAALADAEGSPPPEAGFTFQDVKVVKFAAPTDAAYIGIFFLKDEASVVGFILLSPATLKAILAHNPEI